MKQAKDHLALAIDNLSSLEDLVSLVDSTRESIGVYKIGLEQFIRFGPRIVKEIQGLGSRIFLDLKLHDIPNTVAKATEAACALGIDYLTIHASGGAPMIAAAVKAAADSSGSTCILGVTVLTSIDQMLLNTGLRVPGTVMDQVTHLAGVALNAGCGGIVCSAADLEGIRTLAAGKTVVTPGIRLPTDDVNDQKRITTPQEAIRGGATLLVVGRPINSAKDPKAAAKRFNDAVKEVI